VGPDVGPPVFLGIMVGVPTVAFWGWWRWQKRRRTHAAHLKDLLALTPEEFEQAVADLLTDVGYSRNAARRWCG